MMTEFSLSQFVCVPSLLSVTAGPSAPWTGMIKFTEEDPTSKIFLHTLHFRHFKDNLKHNLMLKSDILQ